jgi:hypothetical protein
VKSWSVYRLYGNYEGETGALLYVGSTNRQAQRWNEHAQNQPWWSDVTGCTVEHFFSESAMLSAERQAIQNENPVWNVKHADPRTRPELIKNVRFFCNGCHKEVTGFGYFGFSLDDEKLSETYQNKTPHGPLALDDFLKHCESSRPAAWKVQCNAEACNDVLPENSYAFELDRIRAVGDFVQLVIHHACGNHLNTSMFGEHAGTDPDNRDWLLPGESVRSRKKSVAA